MNLILPEEQVCVDLGTDPEQKHQVRDTPGNHHVLGQCLLDPFAAISPAPACQAVSKHV